MSRHLSSEQISEWMLGLSRPGVREHLRHCARCSDEVTALHEALGGFRHHVRRQSEESYRSRSFSAKPSWQRQQAYWAALAVAVCLLMALLLPRHGTPPRSIPTADDAALLKQVSAQLSEAVPSPLEPLALSR